MIFKDITIEVNAERKPFKHFFRATGYANADYTYTPAVRRMYDCLQSYNGHPLYMRLHNILTLHGRGDHYIFKEGQDYGNPVINGSGNVDVVVSVDNKGKPRFNWELVDRVYDIIVSHGMHPIVETVYMPSAAALSAEYYYMPKNLGLWEEIIENFVNHLISRYGLEEVRAWYFEIYNEPEQYPLWNSDPSSFFALYDYFESAIHRVDKNLKAGGPAVKQWEDGIRLFRTFLAHCDCGVNYKTGEYGARLDFISVHSKGGHPDLVGPSIEYMFKPLREFADILKDFPKFRKTEFFNDESDIVWEGNRGLSYKSWLNFRNTHYASGFTAKMIYYYCSILEDELGINLSIVDSDNCHLLWEKSFFSGNRSQFTPLGPAPCADIIRKPVFNIFPLLARLGNERYILKPVDDEYGIKYGALATKDGGGGYAFLLWNFEDGLNSDINERTIRLHVKNLDPEAIYDILHFRIDNDYSNAYGEWCKMGKPCVLTVEQIKTLRTHDGPALLEAPAAIKGITCFDKECLLPMHGVSLVMLIHRQLVKKDKVERAALEKPELYGEKGILGSDQVFLKWPYSNRKDLVCYRIYRQTDSDASPVCINNSDYTQCSYFTDMEVEKGHSYTYSVSAVYADGSESTLSPENSILIEALSAS
jgi:xylan 1,4-beta-xylosidase